MKVLTIQQPWAHLIVTGAKRIENRSWNCPHRGPLLIHAGKSKRQLGPENLAEIEDFYDLSLPDKSEYPLGVIVGVVEMTDCLPLVSAARLSLDFTEGPFCFVLDKAKQFKKPIPATGLLGIWTATDELIAEVKKQMRR